jgi:4-diphosphocytidyl-2C-methyl-D-erythritol kinase
VNPGFSVATADVYALYDVLQPGVSGTAGTLTQPGPGSTMPALSGPGAAEDALSRLLARPNDLEPAAVRLCPVIARLRNQLRALGAMSVGMSGSGATVYGVFTSDSAASEALEAARFEAPVWARVVRSKSEPSHRLH